ncbi:MAG: bifunctional methylenetetrahydrofolate dehydrogenase/methenyltetrahydrofolate cyclohydrolase, partial [Agathobacter sp.]|nr:bifunctional methylenetetrahydrofolate dehydrogenase/methenyltetrahydrofolate cyclohydrolase [Agathobacter sp.]
MDFTCIRFSKDEKEENIRNKITELNNDDTIDGIL